MSNPSKGQTVYIVDEEGGTFAFASSDAAAEFAAREIADGAVAVETFHIDVPREGMTLEQIADYACTYGPDCPTCGAEAGYPCGHLL